ncbi:MAG: zinc ribbon domain-containing protein [Spirochaeta sp.]
MKNKPGLRFFCEHCGADVPPSAIMCPQCGRFFSAVRCPQCTYSGQQLEFKHGCPRCGYIGIPGKSTDSQKKTGTPASRKKGRPLLPLFPSILITLIIAFAVLAIMYVNM